MKKENIIIVEALSTGVNYIHDVRELGYNPICLELYQEEEERKEIFREIHDEIYSLNDEELPQILIAESTYEKTLDKVREFDPLAIIPGCDEGIIMATKLAYDLGLPGNDPKNLKRMIDKQYMQDALKEANIRYVKSQFINTFDEAKEFVSKLDNPYVVIKPSIGEGTIGVCICKDDDELKDAINLNKEVSFGISPDDAGNMIIQEYIGGQEYCINSICCKGHNRVISAFHYERIIISGRGPIYDYLESIDETHPHFKELAEYNDKVLSALGLEYGATHGEYKFDENGPVLIEMNCRVMGCTQKYTLLDTVWGEHATALSLESYINPMECIKKSNKPLEILSHYIIKMIIIYEEIDVLEPTLEDAFNDLESFEYALTIFDGEHVYPKTIDLLTAGGIILLTNTDKSKLLEDLDTIRRIEEFEIGRIFKLR